MDDDRELTVEIKPARKPHKSKESKKFAENLRHEWSLFWEGISSEDAQVPDDSRDPFKTGKLEKLTLQQLKEITKVLSQDRKKLNQKMEGITKELEANNQRLESLKVVGSESAETEQEIMRLTDLGLLLNQQLNLLNERLKFARLREDELKSLAP